MKLKFSALFLIIMIIVNSTALGQADAIDNIIDENYDYLVNLYQHLHSNPELSLQEENTARRISEELNQLGFTVTEKVGGFGLVGVYENGDGPVVLVRSDLDALPMREETNVPFASTQIARTGESNETYVMHACGHDLHMSALIGTARVLTQMKDQWQGTLVLIGQPAEEHLSGARAMIQDGLFERFPEPDYMLALHVNSAMQSGQVGFAPGHAYANVEMGEIIVKGRGGHGAYPDATVDPVVLASKLVVDLQSIISREISPHDLANIAVGSIHGGSSPNIIPNEVVMEVAINVHTDKTRDMLIKRINEKLQGAGMAAGLPEEDWPQLVLNEGTRVSSVYNDPDMGAKVRATFERLIREENVHVTPATMYGEDFGEYNNARPDIPGIIFGVGAISPEDMTAGERGEYDIPTTHSSEFLPDFEPTLRTGIITMSGAVMDLLSGE